MEIRPNDSAGHFAQNWSGTLGLMAEAGQAGASPATFALQRHFPNSSYSRAETQEQALVPMTAEERLSELTRGGMSRRQALRQLARENQAAEVEELRESFEVALALVRALFALEGWRFYVGAFFWVVASLLYWAWLIVALCFVAMNLTGFCFILLLRHHCQNYKDLHSWMLTWQIAILSECIIGSWLARYLRRRPDIAVTLRTSNLAYICKVVYQVAAACLKILWSVDAWALTSAAPSEAGCGDWLPSFAYWFAWVVILHMSGVLVLLILDYPYKRLALWAARRGLLVTGRGAKPGILAAMPPVEYSPELFADPDDPRDERPLGECCCCLEEFAADRRIVRTPCRHIMHESCLELWLRTSDRCPVCRTVFDGEASSPV